MKDTTTMIATERTEMEHTDRLAIDTRRFR